MNDLDIVALGQLMQRKANEARLWQTGADFAQSLQRAIENARDAEGRTKAAIVALGDAQTKYEALIPQFEERTRTLTAEFEGKRKDLAEKLQGLRSEIAALTTEMGRVRTSRDAEIEKIATEREAARKAADDEIAGLKARIQAVKDELQAAKDRAAKA